MKFIIHSAVRSAAPDAIDWIRAFLSRFDTSDVGWLRVDFGREHRDRKGRVYYRYRGVYGRCWYPTERQPTLRLSCQVPGPFPCEVVTRKKPVYRNADGTWPAEARRRRGPVLGNPKTGRQWKRVYGTTRLADLAEAVVWIFAHEAFHWLRKSGQVPGRNTEIEADAYADAQLEEFRRVRHRMSPGPPDRRPAAAATPARPVQGELFPT